MGGSETPSGSARTAWSRVWLASSLLLGALAILELILNHALNAKGLVTAACLVLSIAGLLTSLARAIGVSWALLVQVLLITVLAWRELAWTTMRASDLFGPKIPGLPFLLAGFWTGSACLGVVLLLRAVRVGHAPLLASRLAPVLARLAHWSPARIRLAGAGLGLVLFVLLLIEFSAFPRAVLLHTLRIAGLLALLGLAVGRSFTLLRGLFLAGCLALGLWLSPTYIGFDRFLILLGIAGAHRELSLRVAPGIETAEQRIRWLALIPVAVVGVWLAGYIGNWGGTYFRSDVKRGGLVSVVEQGFPLLTDFDADGFGLGFGPADCAPFDANANPSLAEIPGNQRDDNCRHGDAEPRPNWAVERGLDVAAPAARLPQHRGDVLVLLIDSLRWDEAHAPGLPNLAQLAATSIDFEQARTTAPYTTEALLSLFTGELASQREFIFEGPYNGYPSAPIGGLVPYLARLGFETVWIGAGSEHGAFSSKSLGDGFHVRQHEDYHATSQHFTDRVLELHRSMTPGKRFLFAHYLYVHNALYAEGASNPEEFRRRLREWDTDLGRLLTAVGPETLVIVVGDHGEEFGEHGRTGHAATLFEESVRMAMMLRIPGSRPQLVRAPVSLRALGATLARLVAPTSGAAADAASQALALPPELARAQPLCLAEPCAATDVPFELKRPGRHLRGFLRWPWKVVEDVSTGVVVAYELTQDPRERNPVAPPKDLAQLLAEYDEYLFGCRNCSTP